MRNDCVYWIWFQLLFGIGTRRSELLMHHFGHPRAIYDGIAAKSLISGLLEQNELSRSEAAMEQAELLERRTLKKGCAIITPDHPQYPPLLKAIDTCPSALYIKGDLSCLDNRLAIAMVGTRRHSDYGRDAAAVLAKGLAEKGAVVVSGLAPGIDSDSHQAALAAGGKTIGVLGCGLDIDYPTGSGRLKRAVSENGAVVTEFPLGAQPYRGNFPLRNRIISGMSHGTLVVEAGERSGSLITARLAREQGRPLFAVPGNIFSDGGKGPNMLLKDGAYPVENAGDILEQLPQYAGRSTPRVKGVFVEVGEKPPRKQPRASRKAEPPKEPSPPTKELPEGVSEPARLIHGCFDKSTLTVDDLAAATGMETGAILSALTELELYGILTSYPGRRFGLAK